MSSSRSLALIDSGGNTDYTVEEMEFRVLFNGRDVSWILDRNKRRYTCTFQGGMEIEVARFTAAW